MTLELGGKSPLVIFNDADGEFDSKTLSIIMLRSGQFDFGPQPIAAKLSMNIFKRICLDTVFLSFVKNLEFLGVMTVLIGILKQYDC